MTKLISKRPSAKRVAIFNHKGGVGKTTITLNLASALAAHNKTVLLVDSDPQCNLSAYLLDDDTIDALLDESDGSEGATVWSAVKPVVDSTGQLKAIPLVET